MPGLIFVMALYSFPLRFFDDRQRLRADLVGSSKTPRRSWARTNGASAWTVTLPLAMPALIGGFILAFLQSLVALRRAGDSRPARRACTRSRRKSGRCFNIRRALDMAAAFSVPLLLATMALIAVQKKFSGAKAIAPSAAKADRNA